MQRTLMAAALLCLAMPAWAQPADPSIENGRIERHAAAASLTRQFESLDRGARPVWFGYAIATRSRGDDGGCWDGSSRRAATPIRLEGPAQLFVLFRMDQDGVDRILFASPQCPLDLGGLTLHWLTGVTAASSLDWLVSVANGAGEQRTGSSAVTAIALHGDDAAADRLLALAKDGRHSRVRSNALFWLGQRAGDRSAGAITDAIQNDPDTQVKRQAVFALSRLPRGQGVPRLIDVARTNRDPEVRKQAMFWLGQSQDPRALAFFEEVLRGK